MQSRSYSKDVQTHTRKVESRTIKHHDHAVRVEMQVLLGTKHEMRW